MGSMGSEVGDGVQLWHRNEFNDFDALRFGAGAFVGSDTVIQVTNR